MRSEKQAARRREIEDAAYEALLEKGYAATSMLAIAKRAGASNETLYRWYGDKAGLFRALVESNAQSVAAPLRKALENGAPPLEALTSFSADLLCLLTGARAAALNRAAAAEADRGGDLGQALAAAGRGSVKPVIRRALADALGVRESHSDAEEASEDFIALLVGDLQIRRVTGALAPLTSDEAALRTDAAIAKLTRLYPGLRAG